MMQLTEMVIEGRVLQLFVDHWNHEEWLVIDLMSLPKNYLTYPFLVSEFLPVFRLAAKKVTVMIIIARLLLQSTLVTHRGTIEQNV